jgi:hypothetical protein
MSQYPNTVVEVLDPNAKFKPAALRAIRAFARSHPWRGTEDERKEKFRRLNHDLASAYGIPEPELVFDRLDDSHSGDSSYSPAGHRITLRGRLSVVTLIHEFGHARGMGERGACRWSINLFRRSFPKQYAKLVHEGHMLVRCGRTGGRALRAASILSTPNAANDA